MSHRARALLLRPMMARLAQSRQLVAPQSRQLVAPSGQTVLLQKLSTTQFQQERQKSSSSTNHDQDKAAAVSSQKLVAKIQRLETVDSLLNIIGHRPEINGEEATAVFIRLGQLNPTSEETSAILAKDKRFAKLGQLVDGQITAMTPGVLIRSLSWLLELGPDDAPFLPSFETHLRWILKKMTITKVFQVVELYNRHQETELRRNIYQEALDILRKRWVEISNPKHIVTLMYLIDDKQTDFRANLEERVLEYCPNMKSNDLYKILYILSKHNRRMEPLIKSAVYHIKKQPLDLNTVQLRNLLYATANLNIYDTELLERITVKVLAEVEKGMEMVNMVSILKSFSTLRWRKTEVLDSLWKAVTSNLDNASDLDLVCLFLTFANVDYLPPGAEEVFPQIMTKCHHLEESNSRVWLDVVWSLCVLQKADKVIVSSVLNPDFHKKLIGDPSSKLSPAQLKLININMAARHEVTDYDGPLLPGDFMSAQDVQAPVKADHPFKRKFKRSVLQTLMQMVPETYIQKDVPTGSGAVIDIELVVNDKGEPQKLMEQGSTERNPVPENCHKLALQLLDFSDMTLGAVQPTGLAAMNTRHLQRHGYTVAQIPYTNFNFRDGVVKRVQYMENLIKSVISEEPR